MYFLSEKEYRMALGALKENKAPQRRYEKLDEWLNATYGICPLCYFDEAAELRIVLREADYGRLAVETHGYKLTDPGVKKAASKRIKRWYDQERSVLFVNFAEEMRLCALSQLAEWLRTFAAERFPEEIWTVCAPGMLDTVTIFYHTEEQKRKHVGRSRIAAKLEEYMPCLEEYPFLKDAVFFTIAEESREALDRDYAGSLLYYEHSF